MTAILKSHNSVGTNIYLTKVASLLKRGNKEAFTSHFVPKTEMIQLRVKMV